MSCVASIAACCLSVSLCDHALPMPMPVCMQFKSRMSRDRLRRSCHGKVLLEYHAATCGWAVSFKLQAAGRLHVRILVCWLPVAAVAAVAAAMHSVSADWSTAIISSCLQLHACVHTRSLHTLLPAAVACCVGVLPPACLIAMFSQQNACSS